ncbi:MAG: hypothetical protein QXG00_00205 [Candidatus Woesearchaeota archaeon]
MNIKEHVLTSFLFGVIILKLTHTLSLTALFFVLLANLFDIDHWFRYWHDRVRHKYKNYKKHMYIHYTTKNQRFLVFHTMEFVIVLGFISNFNPIIYYLFIGWLIHFMSDFFVYYKYHKNIEKLFPWLFSWHLVEFFRDNNSEVVRDWLYSFK